MNSPFDTDAKAFEPFYDQTVAIHGKHQELSLKACVFDESFDEPICDVSPSADRRYISVVVPKYGQDGWNSETSPKRGAILTVTSWGGMQQGNNQFAIETVFDFSDSWRLVAREVKR